MYTLSSNMLKWSYNQKNVEGQHFEGVSHSMGYYSMGSTSFLKDDLEILGNCLHILRIAVF